MCYSRESWATRRARGKPYQICNEFNFYLLEIRMYACPVKIQPLEALSIIWAIPMTLAVQGGKIVTLAYKWDDDMTG